MFKTPGFISDTLANVVFWFSLSLFLVVKQLSIVFDVAMTVDVV